MSEKNIKDVNCSFNNLPS